MPRQFYPGAPRDIDEAARRIRRLLEREGAARATMANVPAETALEGSDAQLLVPTSPELAQVTGSGGQPNSGAAPANWPDTSPVLDRVVIRNDSQGRGTHNASRTGHRHQGIDLLASAGSTVYSPIDGKIKYIGSAYRDDARYGGRRTIHIEGPNKHVFKLSYVDPINGLSKGQQISAGAPIGWVQDWQAADDRINAINSGFNSYVTPPGGRVSSHVHMEVLDPAGNHVDPTPWFDDWHARLEWRRRLERIERDFER